MQTPQVLWLSLYLPRLALDAQLQQLTSSAAEAPLVVVENGRALLCAEAATAAGVRAGMKSALVRSLFPAAQLALRDAMRESALLERLACRAGAFTSQVCLLPGEGLLLEIGASLKLFGGYAPLRRQIVHALAGQGLSALRHAAAPVALGAFWLAKAAPEDGLRVERAGLPDALDRLELAKLADDLPEGCVTRLASFGLRRLGELRRLPAAALARRVGSSTLALIARAYGEQADLREAFVFPESFALRIELPSPVNDASALLFAGQRLVQAMSGWLAARQAAITQCHFLLTQHAPAYQQLAPTRLPLRFTAPLRDPERIVAFLGERLARLELDAPVEALELCADAIEDCPGQSRSLFTKEGARPEGIAALVDRLRARLGEEAVCCLAATADHRPEAATSWLTGARLTTLASLANRPPARTRPPRPAAAPPRPKRPLWLLDPAQALAERDGRPHAKGPLFLLAGPERIESGWWDTGEAAGLGDLRRDYYVAIDPEDRWLWIYRDWREPGGWFLHGYFS